MNKEEIDSDCYIAVHSRGQFIIELPEYMDECHAERINNILARKGFLSVDLRFNIDNRVMEFGLGSLPAFDYNAPDIFYNHSFWKLIKWMNSLTMKQPFSGKAGLDELIEVLVTPPYTTTRNLFKAPFIL